MKKMVLAVLAIAILGLTACEKDNTGKKDISVSFSAAEFGIDTEEATEDITVSLTRKADKDMTATIDLTATGVEYGTQFTTVPAASSNKISLTIPKGATTATITLNKATGILLHGDENVEMTISELSETEGVKIGTVATTKVVFGSIVSTGGAMTLEGHGNDPSATGNNYANTVYVDFSANKQSGVDRKSWDLGFWSGSEFRVILNGTYTTVAAASTKTDIDAVTIADAEALPLDLSTVAGMSMESATPTTAFDTPDGKLSTTVFAEVSANDAENLVYFVASAPQKNTGSRGDWYKVKVTRNGNGYKVHYGKVSGGAIATVEVPKTAGYNFSFLSLEAGQTVAVEPAVDKWDIKWGYDYGAAATGMTTLYIFTQDFVAINNHGGVKVATVMTADVSYNDFASSHISGLTFEDTRDAVGTKWRITAMPGVTNAGVNTDSFYVVKDAAGNYYKFRFVRVGINSAGGERGRPELEYKQVV